MQAKSLVKSLAYTLLSAKQEEIIASIRKFPTVSFDVFDTLIKRMAASPKDVFFMMENKLLQTDVDDMAGFATWRIEAERTARKANHGREVTLEDIYKQISVSDEQRFKLMRLECQTEIEISRPNIPIKHVYEACVQQGKKILFISDMYLPSKVIGQILRKNGYETGHLYISCESGRTKRDGGLFTYVQKAEDLTFDSWFHMGDAIPGDFLSPRRLGIRTALVDRNLQYDKHI